MSTTNNRKIRRNIPRCVRISIPDYHGKAASKVTLPVIPEAIETLSVEDLTKTAFNHVMKRGKKNNLINPSRYSLTDSSGREINDSKLSEVLTKSKLPIPHLYLTKTRDIPTNTVLELKSKPNSKVCVNLQDRLEQMENEMKQVNYRLENFERVMLQKMAEIHEQNIYVMQLLKNKESQPKQNQRKPALKESQKKCDLPTLAISLPCEKNNESFMREKKDDESKEETKEDNVLTRTSIRKIHLLNVPEISHSENEYSRNDFSYTGCSSMGNNLAQLEISRSCLSEVYQPDESNINSPELLDGWDSRTNQLLKFFYKDYEIGTTGILKIPEKTNDNLEQQTQDVKMKIPICESDFEKLGALGRGQCGSVTKCLHLGTFKYVALKRMSTEKNENRRQIVHELDAFKVIGNSPYVVSFHGAYMDCNRNICMAMEYMDGSSLKDFVFQHERTLPEYIIRHITFQLTNGLKHLENRRVIHRDLKPDNILIHHNGAIKIADFGLLIGKDSCTKSCQGTKAYMSPERLNLLEYGTASDIWSLGLCLVYCAIGYNPFDRIGEWDAPIIESGFDLRTKSNGTKYSEELCLFIDGCLQNDPNKRSTPDQLLNHSFLDSIHEPDLIEKDQWTKFCKRKRCMESELNILLDMAACKLTKLPIINNEQKDSIGFDAMIERLSKMSNYTCPELRTKLIPKIEKMEHDNGDRHQLIIQKGNLFKKKVSNCESNHLEVVDDQTDRCSVLSICNILSTHSTSTGSPEKGEENTMSPGEKRIITNKNIKQSVCRTQSTTKSRDFNTDVDF